VSVEVVAFTETVICVLLTLVMDTEENAPEETVNPLWKLDPVMVRVPPWLCSIVYGDALVGALIVGVEHAAVVVVVDVEVEVEVVVDVDVDVVVDAGTEVVVVAAPMAWGSPTMTTVEVSVIDEEPKRGPMKEYEGLGVVTETLTSSMPGVASAHPPDTGVLVPAP
jgi:hypothetical protein